ncbi:hypothetical protein ACRRTK_010244 [Alexandromys fortis]
MLTRLLFYVINWESNYGLLSVAVIDNYNQKQPGEAMVGFSFLLHVAVYHREVRLGAKAGAGDGTVEEKLTGLLHLAPAQPASLNIPGPSAFGWHCPQEARFSYISQQS